jgi:queuine tRNA-ribosyltransferase
MQKLAFTIAKTKGNARVGEFTLNGITVQTPCFMPVGTQATIKALPLEFLSAAYLWTKASIRLILNNTFHLHLHPGEDLLAQWWGIHRFQHRDGLILTDSWGFQVFSLWLSKTGKPLVKLRADGVQFKSPSDGSTHFFSPIGTVDIQRKLGSDIMMMLDVCSPVHNITKRKVAEHMDLTHRRAKEQFAYHSSVYEQSRGVLFPIVQGGLYPDLRAESAQALSQYARDGIGIGGLSVWETREEMYGALDHLVPHLPTNVPRYLMGVGTPQDLREAIYRGIDLFDCVMPTRLGRHGTAFTHTGTIKLKNASYKTDTTPLDPRCRCHTCRHFTKAYLHHLCKQDEMLAATLLSLHNIAFLHRLVEEIREEILQDT